MPVPTELLQVGRCYRTAKAEVVKIVSFDGSRVIYVVERNGIESGLRSTGRSRSSLSMRGAATEVAVCRMAADRAIIWNGFISFSGLAEKYLTRISGRCRSRGSASGGTLALGRCRPLGARGPELHTLGVHNGSQGRLAEKRLTERAVDPQLDAPPHIDGEPERAVLALGAEKYDHGIVVRRDALQHKAVAVPVADRYRLLGQHGEDIVCTGGTEQQS